MITLSAPSSLMIEESRGAGETERRLDKVFWNVFSSSSGIEDCFVGAEGNESLRRMRIKRVSFPLRKSL